MTFVSQSTIEIYKQWIAEGKKIPLEEIIALTTKLICSDVNDLASIANFHARHTRQHHE